MTHKQFAGWCGAMLVRFATGILLVFSLAACETPSPSLYHWGGYDASVGRVASASDDFDLQAEIARLSAEMRRTTDAGLQLPPGFRIHLAYLYLLQGERSSAQELLAREKDYFPESRMFIDGLMARVVGQPAASGKAGRLQREQQQ